jgi:pimeloyl-ACP methyl ester carboxylesterase
MRWFFIITCVLVLPLIPLERTGRRQAAPPEHVSFPTEDGGLVYADLYGEGDRGVVLAHGGRFNKDSWAAQARELAKAGFRVLAFDFRGYGQSRGNPRTGKPDEGRRFDVLAAIRYLRKAGAKRVSVVGASMGGDYAAEAAEAAPAEMDRLVLIAAGAYTPLTRMKRPKLFILCRDDFMGDDRKPRLPRIRAQYEQAREPKELVLLDGDAHAQVIFETEQGERLMREILRFLFAR